MLRTAIELGKLMRQAREDPERRRRRRGRQLRRLARLAAARSAFHRERLARSGLHPDSLGTAGALECLPVMERDDLVQHLESIKTRQARRSSRELRTSGSTGRPLRTWISPSEGRIRQALHLRSRLLAGRGALGREVVIGSFAASNRKSVRLTPFGRTLYLSANLEGEVLNRELHAFKPDYLVAFPSTLLRLGDQPSLSMRLVTTGSEVLESDVRELLEWYLGAPVRDVYGTVETGLLAFQCAIGRGYHLNDDVVHFEFGRTPKAEGDLRDLFVTPLYATTVPLIRYRVGDLVRLEPTPCPCGSTLPRIMKVEGRSDDWLVRRDGREVPPSSIREIFRGRDRLLGYRITQEPDGRIALELDLRQGDAECARAIARAIKSLAGQDVRILGTAEIRPDASGKIRAIRRIHATTAERPGSV